MSMRASLQALPKLPQKLPCRVYWHDKAVNKAAFGSVIADDRMVIERNNTHEVLVDLHRYNRGKARADRIWFCRPWRVCNGCHRLEPFFLPAPTREAA